jgi:Tol biopolymer transport system component
VLTQPDFSGSGYAHVYPQYLPNGRDILFSIFGSRDPVEPAAVYSLDTMGWEIVLPNVGAASYLPTGHLLFSPTGGTNQLVARVFDLESLTPRGGSVGVVESVFEVSGAARPAFATSLKGTLGFEPPAPEAQIVWVDREGNRQPLDFPAGYYHRPRLSPDGDRIALVDGRQVLMREVATGTPTTIPNVGTGNHVNPMFTPDGSSITFASNEAGSWDIYEFQVDSNQAGQLLLGKDFDQFPDSWSRDGRFLAYREAHPETSYDIWIWPKDGEEEWSLVQSPGNDRFAAFSPNGEWIAYASDEFGRDQVYLCSFPDCSTRKTVSTGGGTEPRWSQDGKELFFRNGNRMWVVEILDPTTMEMGDQDALFEGVYQPRATYLNAYDVHPDGRFMMLTDTSGHQINIVLNWFEELKRLVPTP